MQWPWQRPAAHFPPAPAPKAAARASLPLLSPPPGSRGRPSWWRPGESGRGLLYPDDPLDQLLEELRRTVPLVDRAVTVLALLCGEVRLLGPEKVTAELSGWMRSVRVNQGGRGLSEWLTAHLDGLLLYGRGWGELVPNRERTDLFALTNLDPRSLVFGVTADPLTLRRLQRQWAGAHAVGSATLVELPPRLSVLSVHAPAADRPHGTSLFRSTPYVAKVSRIIENATAQLWQRMGSPPFHINWEPDNEFSDPTGEVTAGVLADLQSQWEAVCRSRAEGASADFFTAGSIKVEIPGQHGPVVSIQESFRIFTEQLLAVTGLPPWLLGLHWNSTERLSTQQAELLVAQIEGLRGRVTPAVEEILELRQQLSGKSGKIRVAWSPITLTDATEQARAKAWEAQAFTRKLHNAARMWELGLWSQAMAARYLDPTLEGPARPLELPPTLPGAGPATLGPEG